MQRKLQLIRRDELELELELDDLTLPVQPNVGSFETMVSMAPQQVLDGPRGAWFDGKHLVLQNGAETNFCHRCGKRVTHRQPYRLSWHSPWLYLLLFPGLVFYLALSIALRRRASVALGECEEHQAKRSLLRGTALSFLLGAIPAGVALAYLHVAVLKVLVVVVSLFVIGLFCLRQSRPTVRRIADGFVFLKGAPRWLLRRLPPFPGSALARAGRMAG